MKSPKSRACCAAKQPKLKPAREAHRVELWRGGKRASAELAERSHSGPLSSGANLVPGGRWVLYTYLSLLR